MSYVALAALCVLFIEMFILLGVRRRIDSIFSVSREATQTMMSSELTDRQKEVAVRKQSLALFKATLAFILLFALMGAVLYGFFAAFIYFFPASEEALVADLVSPTVILLMTIGAIGYVWFTENPLTATIAGWTVPCTTWLSGSRVCKVSW